MSILKRAAAAGMAMGMALSPVCQVFAAETSWFNVEETELTDASFVEDTQYVLTRGNHLSSGRVQLEDKGNRLLALSGNTTCHMVCDKVTCNLYLEQLDDESGDWYTYKYWLCSTTNAYSYSPERTVTVEGDHWYRARGAHMATKNGTIESVSTATDGIWVD